MRPIRRIVRSDLCGLLERGLSAVCGAYLEISPSTGVQWARCWRETGGTAAKPMAGVVPSCCRVSATERVLAA